MSRINKDSYKATPTIVSYEDRPLLIARLWDGQEEGFSSSLVRATRRHRSVDSVFRGVVSYNIMALVQDYRANLERVSPGIISNTGIRLVNSGRDLYDLVQGILFLGFDVRNNGSIYFLDGFERSGMTSNPKDLTKLLKGKTEKKSLEKPGKISRRTKTALEERLGFESDSNLPVVSSDALRERDRYKK